MILMFLLLVTTLVKHNLLSKTLTPSSFQPTRAFQHCSFHPTIRMIKPAKNILSNYLHIGPDVARDLEPPSTFTLIPTSPATLRPST